MLRKKVRRKTHKCTNCDTGLVSQENFCPACGQENHDLNVSMKALLLEVIGSFTFFETKFIETARIIFTKPGLLTLDFNAGKRAKYMHPVRMYFWVTTILFFMLSLKDSQRLEARLTQSPHEDSLAHSRFRTQGRLMGQLFAKITGKKPNGGFNSKNPDSLSRQKGFPKDSLGRPYSPKVELGMFQKLVISRDSIRYYYQLSSSQLDSVLATKHISTFFSNKIHIENSLKEAYNRQLNKRYGVVTDDTKGANILNILSNLVFIMIPFAALILWFFERHSLWKFYFQHLVFTLYTHSAIFMIWAFYLLFSIIANTKLDVFFGATTEFIPIILGIICLGYFFISLKKVYQQSWPKTTIKFILLTFSYALTFFFVLLFGVFSGLFAI